MDKRILGLAILLLNVTLFLPVALAVEQPNNYNPIYTLAHKDIVLYSGSIEGTACTNRYATSGDYCSGNIRMYYQCDYKNGGLTWQKRSENCMDYGYLCVSGDCVLTSTQNILYKNIKQVLVFLGIIGFFGYLYLRDKKKK